MPLGTDTQLCKRVGPVSCMLSRAGLAEQTEEQRSSADREKREGRCIQTEADM